MMIVADADAADREYELFSGEPRSTLLQSLQSRMIVGNTSTDHREYELVLLESCSTVLYILQQRLIVDDANRAQLEHI
jgi:hypothetical protein